MNKVILMGRLTRDPEVRYSQGDNAMAIARYTLAVDRRFSRNNGDDQQSADFRLKCTGCGHQIMIPRRQAEKNIREILPGSKE